jgi:hypothetical protein
MVPVAPIITGATFVFEFHMRGLYYYYYYYYHHYYATTIIISAFVIAGDWQTIF